jgi:FkbM family methyltransferase
MMERKERNGLVVNVRDWPSSDHIVVGEIFDSNVYGFKPSMIEHGVVIDIGANIGCFSLLVSPYAKTVMCFEPERHNYDVLCQNMRDNDAHFLLFKKAVGFEDGESTINDLGGCSALGMSGETVDVWSLNRVLDLVDHVDILKMDIEGGEWDALRGVSDENLAKVRFLAIELHITVDEKKFYETVAMIERNFVSEYGMMLWRHK